MELRSSATPEDGRHPGATGSRWSASTGCDPRPPRRMAATAALDRDARAEYELRSSATPEDGRHLARQGGAVGVGEGVAILGHPRGWPPPFEQRGSHGEFKGCDPRPPRRMAATSRRCVTMPASIEVLRSSAIPEDGRHLTPSSPATYTTVLRSSATPEDGRHPPRRRLDRRVSEVAILGHPGGWPPPWHLRVNHIRRVEGCDPRPPRRMAATRPASVPPSGCPRQELRSSATPEDGRHRVSARPGLPRGYKLRSSATPEDGRHSDRRSIDLAGEIVAILGHPGGWPPLGELAGAGWPG